LELAKRLGVSEFEPLLERWRERFLIAGSSGLEMADLADGAQLRRDAPTVAFQEQVFPTPSGKASLIDNISAELVFGEEGVAASFPLTLLSVSTPQSQASQWSGPIPEVAECWIHPESSELADGARAVLESEVGEMEVVIRHSPSERRDTVRIAKGGHFDRGQSANVLIAGTLTDFGEGGSLYDQPVRLRQIES
jgi:anaerobic selenocysteine-containing dehydrogenase